MTLAETTRRRTLLGYLAALAAAASYGSSAVVVRHIVAAYTAPLVGVAFSLAFGTAIMAVLFHRHVAADWARTPWRAWLWMALAGGASAWGIAFWFQALSKAPVVQVEPVVATSPLLAIAFTHIFLRRLERVTRRTVLGALLVVAGVVLIVLGTE